MDSGGGWLRLGTTGMDYKYFREDEANLNVELITPSQLKAAADIALTLDRRTFTKVLIGICLLPAYLCLFVCLPMPSRVCRIFVSCACLS